MMSSLDQLMPNVGGYGEPKIRLLAGVMQSVLLYGALTWVHTLRWKKPVLAVVAAVQRWTALRSVCAYRTVTHDAVEVMLKIDFLAYEI